MPLGPQPMTVTEGGRRPLDGAGFDVLIAGCGVEGRKVSWNTAAVAAVLQSLMEWYIPIVPF